MALILIALTLGPMLAAVATIAMWLTLGGSTLMWRSIVAVLGGSLLGLVFCAVSGELEAEWLGLMWVVVITVAAMFVVVRRQGLRLVDTKKPIRRDSDEFRFSVLHLLGLTAVVALIATFARALAPLVATLNALMFGLGIAVCLGSLAIIGSLTTLRLRQSQSGLWVFVVASVVIAGTVFTVMEATNADPGIVWGSIVVVYALSLRALFGFLRNRGFAIASDSDLALTEIG